MQEIIHYQFDVSTVALILRGLGRLPHDEVRTTYDAIVSHMNAMLNPPAVDPVLQATDDTSGYAPREQAT
jgi:hypothetical protein